MQLNFKGFRRALVARTLDKYNTQLESNVMHATTINEQYRP
jgi:hypothetical protein